MSYSQGSVTYDGGEQAQTLASTAANDGLSVSPAGIVQLGQNGANGGVDAAAITEDRWIPSPGGNAIYIGKNDGISASTGLTPGEIFVSNPASPAYALFDGVNNAKMVILALNRFSIVAGPDTFQYFYASRQWSFLTPATVLINRLSQPVSSFVFASSPLLVNGTIATAYHFIAIDTTGGNFIVTYDPTALIGQEIIFQKISTDVNTVTINCTTGANIISNGIGVAALVIALAGGTFGLIAQNTGKVYITQKN